MGTYRHPDTQTDTQSLRLEHTDTQTYRYTDIQIHRHTDTLSLGWEHYTDKKTHRYIQTYRHTDRHSLGWEDTRTTIQI